MSNDDWSFDYDRRVDQRIEGLRAENDRLREQVRELQAENERLQGEIGDAWEAVGHERTGAVTARTEFGPAGGPYTVVEEGGEPRTLAEFLTSVEEGLREFMAERDAAREQVRQQGEVIERVRALADEFANSPVRPERLRAALDGDPR